MTFGGIVADLGSALEALAKWSNANQGLVAVIAAVVTALVTIAAVLLTHWLGSRKAAPAPRSGEINYLIALEQYLLDLQKMPLAHDESEILALHAEMVLPQYRIFDATSPKDNSGRKGQTTRNLAHALLASDKPVVVKGDPGAGKSVSLRRVGLDLARRERARKHPRLPIYLRLGTFTQPVDADPQSSVLDFVRRSLHAFGGTANTVLEHFDEYLAEGRFVFLFDAMDEMPRADYEARFNALAGLRSYVPNKLLFACRSLDFRESFPFRRAQILPFSRRQIKQFLRKAVAKDMRAAYKAILSPANPLRDMAANPYFLKLLSLFYKELGRPPLNRAELMQTYERQVFTRARQRQGFPSTVTLDSFSAVLSRLGYLIMTNRRGVTLPTEELKLQFIDLMPTAGPRLSAYVDAIDDVLTVALSENLLVTDWETIDGRERPVLSFYHHRLQEYYAAEYIGRFEPVIDWTTHYDDIWWQEVLITLSGIVANPQQLIGDLVASFPARPLVCYQFGEVLAGNRREVLSSDLSFYFLKDVRELSEEECRSYLRETLGIREAPYSWKLMSPEPDEYESADAVRRWLERHNARLLDRLQLAVECARNCTATISSDIQHRISSVLRRFVEFGNQMEIVRCIGIGALLQKSDLYAIVEPALIGGSAWVRREAMEALAIYPITGAVHLRPVGFVIFLQFLRGELLYSIPRLWRSTVAQRKLVWFWPGIAFLIILSFIGALLPFCLYYLLLYLFPTGPRGFTDSLGLTWTRWAWALTALGVITTYSVKYRYGLSIVRTTLVIGSVLGALAIAPVLIGHVPASLSVGERAKITNVASVLHDVPQMMRIGIAFVGTGVFAIAAQTVEVIAVTTLACICFLNFRSPYLFSAAWTYAQDSLHSRSNLDKFQIAWGVIEGSGAAACFLLALLSLTIFSAVAWLADHAMYVIYAAGVVGGLIAIVLLLQICSEVGRHLTIFFKRPRHEQLTFVARTVAGAFLLLVGLRLLYYFFSWVVLPIWRFLVVHAVLLVYLLVLTALCLFSVVIAYPMLREARDLIMFLAVRYLGVKTRDETAVPTLQTERTARALTEAAIAHSLSSSRTRYDRLRQLLRYIKPQWARAWVYQRLRETHQEIRQDSLPRDAGGEEAR